MGRSRFERGALWKALVETSARSLRSGARRPIPTEIERVEDRGVRFIVRVLAQRENLDRKVAASTYGRSPAPIVEVDERRNPFLPYDEDLFVADLSETHLCVLNKFNVVDHHLLIVTRDFQDQESALDVSDFQAMWTCMAEYEGLAFYNAGEIAGASQRHKHLQMVPIPLIPGDLAVPIDSVIDRASLRSEPDVLESLPFPHAIAIVEPSWLDTPAVGAGDTAEVYGALLGAVGIGENDPYNLLVTRSWMLLVPRSRERFESISVNALGFAGSLLVRSEAELSLLRRQGLMKVLDRVALRPSYS
jgi:ATP adenylyltransferase